MPRRGFTLVELLVVITIIVVLLALIVPAMDQAIYQAELAVCAATKNGLGRGITSYTAENKRAYPDRPGVFGDDWPPSKLSYDINWAPPTWDLRPKLRPYVPINPTFNCPLIAELDLEGSLPSSHVHSTYNLWFGMQFRTANGGDGMLRLGDRWEWNDDGVGSRLSSNLIAGTRYAYVKSEGYTTSSHPGETYTPDAVWQDRPAVATSAGGILVGAGNTYTLAGWYSHSPQRGPIDLNSLFDDGSVRRYNGVAFEGDERIARVPLSSGAAGWAPQGLNWEIVPRQ